MRMWMVNPEFLCTKHLLGEHNELHKFRHMFERKQSVNGRIGQIFPAFMEYRHLQLVQEMQARGYKHSSPYKQPDLEYLQGHEILKHPDLQRLLSNLMDLMTRCPACKLRIASYIG